MAKRESQGLQIALIVFVMVTVLFMVTTVLFWKKADTANTNAADVERQLTTVRDDLRTAQDENENLKRILGYAPGQAWSEIENEFNQALLAYAQGLPEDQRNYRALPDQFMKALADKNDRLVKASNNELALKKKMEEVRHLESGRTSQALMQKTAAEADLARDKSQFDRERERITQMRSNEQRQYRESLALGETNIKNKDEEVKTTTETNRRLTIKNEDLQQKLLAIETQSLDVADGEIIWVNQNARIVWINLGRSDAVREQMTFSVYDAGEQNLSHPKVKGRIEVLRVVDDHQSEASMLSDQLSNPILHGDVIHSHIWQPGVRLRFALAGKIDVDEDGRSDRELLQELIEVNGGIVDAFVDEQGNRTGNVTINTRYLILGDPPEEENALRGYSDIIKDADTQGVQKIPVSDILNYVGYDGTQGTIRLGTRARAVDFKAKPEEGVIRTSRGKVSELYQKEKPPYRTLPTTRSVTKP